MRPRPIAAVLGVLAGRSTALLTLLACTTPVAAQEFVFAPEALPGPNNKWSGGVEACDVDRDGDVDLLFAEGGGLTGGGTPEQNRLVVNHIFPPPSEFSDESVARLGVHESIAKAVFSGDIQGDGWSDVLFCNLGAPPSLYVNRGTTGPGVFDFEGVERGLVEALDSFGGQFGDLDEDGDLDLVLANTTDSLPRLYLNDGAGHFVEAPAALPAAPRDGQIDVQLVDVDGDWDLDFFGANLHTGDEPRHYLMLNDGLGNFTDASSLVPSSSQNVYEAEVADLDGDLDTDFFFLGLSGLEEGVVENELVPSEQLSFASTSTFLGGEDHELAFLDWDFDDDLDVLIAGFGAGAEVFLRNLGGLDFAVVPDAVSATSDATLDATFADLDLDGAYDLITACGQEGHPADWTNKIYYNGGATDLTPPTIVRQRALSDGAPKAGPWTVLVEARDQVVDDGVRGIVSQVVYEVDEVSANVAATPMGGGLFRAELTDVTGGLATQLSYAFVVVDPAGNQNSTGFQTVDLCGTARFGMDAPGVNEIQLDASGTAAPSGSLTFVSQGGQGPAALFLLSLGSSEFPLFGGTGLVDPVGLIAAPGAPWVDGAAELDLLLPDEEALTGLSFYVQSIAVDASEPGGFALSNGVAVTLCEAALAGS